MMKNACARWTIHTKNDDKYKHENERRYAARPMNVAWYVFVCVALHQWNEWGVKEKWKKDREGEKKSRKMHEQMPDNWVCCAAFLQHCVLVFFFHFGRDVLLNGSNNKWETSEMGNTFAVSLYSIIHTSRVSLNSEWTKPIHKYTNRCM